MTKISVIIPVYNASAHLRQCLDSVLKQSLKEIEVICVDDGSTDDSLSILGEYAGKDSRVKVLTQKNLHAGAARNTGLAAATGEYVHFLDADDYVLDFAYEAIYCKIVKYDLEMLRFPCVVYDTQREISVDRPAFTLTKLRPGDFHRPVGLEAGSPLYSCVVTPWAGIYQRAFLNRIQARFNTLNCVNDRSFFWKVVTNAQRTMFCRDLLVVYRTEMKDSLIGIRKENFDCHFESIEIVSRQLQEDGVEEEAARRIMQKEFLDMLEWMMRYHTDPQLGQDIMDRAAAFVARYDGMFRYLLKDLFDRKMKELARWDEQYALFEAGEGDEPRPLNPIHNELPIKHGACEHPKVSVILPIYNVEDYLNEALYSLSIQTLDEMEFLCISDGSKDSSMVIMKEYAALDKRFIIIDKPNAGYGQTMNKGIDAAKGEYIGILEPDDFVPANMFGDLYKIAAKNDLDLIKADFYRFKVRSHGGLQSKLNQLSRDKSYYGRLIDTSKDIVPMKFIMNTWSGIYKRSFLNKFNIRHNETPGASYQDNGFWFQTFTQAQRAWFVNKPYYMNRRDNPNSSMFNKSKIYCVTNEYKFIQAFMDRNPEIKERFTPIFYAKKFANFMVTFRRIEESAKLEYLHHICDEFGPAMKAGLLDRELLGETYWKQINEILADPEAYYEKIRVSVIIPVYNAEEYLRQTLDSVLIWNEIRFEVICVDDGSTDSSLEILREYEQKDNRVIVLTQENGGAGKARNTGLKIARGEYLSFLDADDFFEPEMLRAAYEKAYLEESDIVAFRCDQYFADNDVYSGAAYTINSSLLPANRPFAATDVSKDIFKLFVGWAWDKLFRADYVRALGLTFQEQRTTNDMLFVFSAVVKAERISIINTIFAHHRRDSGSLSVTREKSWDCCYNALIALRKQLKDWGLYETYERDFVNYSIHFLLWNLNSIRGEAYYKLYDALKNVWVPELGLIREVEEDYYFNAGELETMKNVLELEPDEYLFYDRDSVRDKLSNQTARANRFEAEAKKWKGKHSKRKEQHLALREKYNALKPRAAKAKKMRNSASWKIGRAITWLPRKIKGK